MTSSSPYIKVISAALLFVAAAAGQNPDHGGNAALKGDYFVREVLMTGGTDGSVTAAASVIGMATFDGNGNYTFKGQGTTLASGPNASVSLSGTYNVASNSFLEIQSLAQTFLDSTATDYDFGGVSALGPSAFVASATEASNVTMLVGIPAGSNVSNAAFKGAYTAGAIDYPSASITDVREGTFTLNSDGAGNLGSVPISGAGALLGSPIGTAQTQTDLTVTYTLSGEGSGTINFGSATNSQLVSGSKVFYISADGNLVLGGSATGYDMLVGMKALAPGTGTNATASGEYFLAALEDQIATDGSTNLVDAYYGSVNTTGSGTAFFHNRFQSLQELVYDYTFDSTAFDLSSSGTVPFGGDTPYSYTFGANGQAYIATGDATDYSYYSLTLGLAMQKFSGSGVYLAPNGIVSSANFAPITNPIAPNEFITLFGNFGAGLSSGITATNLPLPTTLGPISVTINGVMAPLDYVSAGQITALVPSAISPDNSVYYATVVVTNNNVASNPVTVYTSNTAPGVFANPVAVGEAAAEHADGSQLNSGSPANIGDTIVVFAGGLGAITPPVVPDGAAASANPLSNVADQTLYADFSGTTCAALNPSLFPDSNCSLIPFAGLTPTAAGLYQINTPVPTGTPTGTPDYFDVSTYDGYTSFATISVAGGSSAAERAHIVTKRLERNKTRARKSVAKPRVTRR